MIIYKNDKVLDLSEEVFGEEDESILINLIEQGEFDQAKSMALKILEKDSKNCAILQILGESNSSSK
jgi:hypothetical protein